MDREARPPYGRGGGQRYGGGAGGPGGGPGGHRAYGLASYVAGGITQEAYEARQRRQRQRKTVDFNSSVVRYLEVRWGDDGGAGGRTRAAY